MTFPTTGILTTFTGPNENPISEGGAWSAVGAPWVVMQRYSNVAISSTAGGFGMARRVTTTGADCEAYVFLAAGTDQFYVTARHQTGDDTDHYMVVAEPSSSTIGIYRVTNGTPVLLGATISQAISTGDGIGIECVGNSIRAYYYNGSSWSLAGTRTDSTYSAGGYIGMGVEGWSTGVDDFGGGTIVTGQTVSPSGIATAEAFGSPTIVPGAVAVSPSGIASAEAFGTPTFYLEAFLNPSGVASEEAFGDPTLSLGPVTLTPGGIPSDEGFGVPTLVPGEVILSPSGIATAEAFGVPTFDLGAVILTPASIVSEEAFGAPTVVPGEVTITSVGIVSEEAFGVPALVYVLLPAGIPSEEAFGIPMMVLYVSPTSITSEEAFGIPVVEGGLPPVVLEQPSHGRWAFARFKKDVIENA